MHQISPRPNAGGRGGHHTPATVGGASLTYLYRNRRRGLRSREIASAGRAQTVMMHTHLETVTVLTKAIVWVVLTLACVATTTRGRDEPYVQPGIRPEWPLPSLDSLKRPNFDPPPLGQSPPPPMGLRPDAP